MLGVCALLFPACGDESNTKKITVDAGDPVLENGRALFQMNCSSCHNLEKEMTGPALKGALARWKNDTTNVKSFIRNSSAYIKKGDPYTTALFQKYNKTTMTPFTHLSEADLDAIIRYIGQ